MIVSGSDSLVKLLVKGAELEARNLAGSTALHLAATQGHHHMVVGLLDMGLDPNALNEHNRSEISKTINLRP